MEEYQESLIEMQEEQETADDNQFLRSTNLLKSSEPPSVMPVDCDSVDAPLLKALIDSEAVYMGKLKTMVNMYATIEVGKMAFSQLSNAEQIMGPIEQMRQQHEFLNYILTSTVAKKSNETQPWSFWLALTDDALLDNYYSYASGWHLSTKMMRALLSLPAFREAVESKMGVQRMKELRMAPLRQIPAYLAAARRHVALLDPKIHALKIGQIREVIAKLKKLENFIDIQVNSYFVLGSAERARVASGRFDDSRFTFAAYHIYRAMTGDSTEKVNVENLDCVRAAIWFANLGFIRNFLLFCLMVLSFFELPMWCRNQTCGLPNAAPIGSEMYTSNIPVLNVYADLTIELVILLALVAMGPVLQYLSSRQPSKFFFPTSHTFITSLALFISVVDNIVSFATLKWLRLSLLLRPVLWCMASSSTRQQLRDMSRAVYKSLVFYIFILFFLIIMAIIAIVLYSESLMRPNPFTNYADAMLVLQEAITTVNYPDVMIPAYALSRWTFIYWLFFYCVGFFFILPMLLGEIRANFNESRASRQEKFFRVRSEQLQLAFNHLLSPPKTKVKSADLMRVILTFGHLFPFSGGERDRSMARTRVMQLMGTEYHCDRARFGSPTGILFVMRARTSGLDMRYPWLISFMQHWIYKVITLILIVINIVVLGLQVAESINPELNLSLAVIIITEFLMAITLIEAILKIIVLGLPRFLRKEIYYTMMVLATIIVEVVMFTYSLNAQVVWNTLLLLRLPMLFQAFNRPVRSVITAAQLFAPLVPVLMAFLYMFSYIGIFIFGGLLYRGNPLLVGTPYEASNYFYYNWNDLGSALVVHFNLLIVNNWNILASGTDAVAGRASRTFIIMYWAISVLTILNVLFSFIFSIVDSSKEAQLQEEREEKEREDAIRRKRMGRKDASDDEGKWWNEPTAFGGDQAIIPGGVVPSDHIQMLTLAEGEVRQSDIGQDIANSLYVEDVEVFGGLAAMQMDDFFSEQPTQTKLKRGNSLVFVGDATEAQGGADGALEAILKI